MRRMGESTTFSQDKTRRPLLHRPGDRTRCAGRDGLRHLLRLAAAAAGDPAPFFNDTPAELRVVSDSRRLESSRSLARSALSSALCVSQADPQ
jgi:hypothetical protein